MLKDLWAGTEASYQDYLAAKAKPKPGGSKCGPDENDPMDRPDEFDPVAAMYSCGPDGVGVVTVSGTTIPGSAGFMSMFGMVGYEDIAGAVLLAVKDKKAKCIMLNINSPGGSVAGLADAADFLSRAGKVKPMSCYADLAASAGYWLASACGNITLASTGIAGSIGVLKVHTEYSKAAAMEGVTTTVMRAGTYKALENPYEPLSDTAKAEVQSKLDDLYTAFITTVAENRSTTLTIADQMMGQGREFLGKRALEAGLVDSIGNYADAIQAACKPKKASMSSNMTASVAVGVVANSTISENSSTKTLPQDPMLTNLTSEELVAMSAGVCLDAPEVAPVAAEIATPTPTVASLLSVEDFLKAELATAQVALASSKTAHTEAVAASEALKSDNETLLSVVKTAVANLSIALNKPVNDSATASELAASYLEMSTQVRDKFKAGRVSAPAAAVDTPAKPTKTSVDPMFLYATQSLLNAQ